MDDLVQIVESAKADFAAAEQSAALEDAKAKYIGKNGAVTALMRGLAGLTPEQKRERGPAINKAKAQIEALLNARREEIADVAMQAKLASEAVDVTLPGRTIARGGIHPVIRTWMRIEEIFASIGFDVADGPEIESDWYSFTALNNPPNHPARSMQDTFYVDRCDEKGMQLPLRPHTSPMQVRYARTHTPPIKVIAPGRTFFEKRTNRPRPRVTAHRPRAVTIASAGTSEPKNFRTGSGNTPENSRNFISPPAPNFRKMSPIISSLSTAAAVC